ncbi:MAG: hypothetical protein KME15_24115 [Drouetiella hepatica Uher 2000/2452]|uniref:Uncharacterized protein n=1 Tax=Drouetiella hepatica Uher 2000/2452 TaxID=904376 RepID=A0A951QFX6_9CYAN|nr:hypothetical protein [Drouetiella hepatica Uher 2000/2452]
MIRSSSSGMATANAVNGKFMVGREAPHHEFPEQTGNSSIVFRHSLVWG